jgi:hypothetical protein
MAGHNRLELTEIGWKVPLAAVVLWAALLLVHGTVFGMPPV